MQLRDPGGEDGGQWIEMGGGLNFPAIGADGKEYKVSGTLDSVSEDGQKAYIKVTNNPNGLRDGIYEMDVDKVDKDNAIARLDAPSAPDTSLPPGAVEVDTPNETNTISGDVGMSKIRDTAFQQAIDEGRFPRIRDEKDVDAAVSSQYKELFNDFKTTYPDLAEKFQTPDDYWNYVKDHGVDTTTPWTDVDKLDPTMQASNKLYAEKVLGVPEGGYIEVYRNSVNHKKSQELSAAGYASLDREMAWDYAPLRGQKDGLDGRYIIRVKPEEVQGSLGFSKARDEYAVVVGPDVTSLPGRITRVGDTEVIPMTPYLDRPDIYDRRIGSSPHRFHSLTSQYDFTPLKEEFTPGNSWGEYMDLNNIPKGALSAEYNKIYGAGAFNRDIEKIGGNLPQYSLFKDMFVKLDDGTWGFEPFEFSKMQSGHTPEASMKQDFMLKMLTAMQSYTGNQFMTPDTGAATQ